MTRDNSKMGFRALRWWRVERPTGLHTAQICIMWESSYSCTDDTAWLPFMHGWLMDNCELSQRTLERHLPQLAKLDLLVKGQGGFRLPRFFTWDRQNGGEFAWRATANLSAKMAVDSKEKESNKEKEKGNERIRKDLSLKSSSHFVVMRDSSAADDVKATQAISAHFRIPIELAEAVFCTGVARHWGTGHTDDIRSASFFANIVEEIVIRWPLPKGFSDYLKRKADEARRGLVFMSKSKGEA